MLYTTTCTSVNDWITLKGIWNEKFGLKKTLVFERTFQVIKIGLYSCRVSHFSLEIFGFVWYVNNSTAYVTLHNDFLGNQEYLWDCRTKSLKTVHVCMYLLVLTQQTFERFNGIISKDIFDFLISYYAVWRICGGVIFISNKSKYLENEVRYARDVKSNLYNFKRSFK